MTSSFEEHTHNPGQNPTNEIELSIVSHSGAESVYVPSKVKQPKYCHYRRHILCCSKDPRYRAASWLLLLGLLGYIIFVAVDLAKLDDCSASDAKCFKLLKIELNDLAGCNDGIPFLFAAEIKNPSSQSIRLESLTISLQYRGQDTARTYIGAAGFGSSSHELWTKGSYEISPISPDRYIYAGTNVVKFASSLEIIDSESLASFFSAFLNLPRIDEVRNAAYVSSAAERTLQYGVEISITATTFAFLFPVKRTVSAFVEIKCNAYGCGLDGNFLTLQDYERERASRAKTIFDELPSASIRDVRLGAPHTDKAVRRFAADSVLGRTGDGLDADVIGRVSKSMVCGNLHRVHNFEGLRNGAGIHRSERDLRDLPLAYATTGGAKEEGLQFSIGLDLAITNGPPLQLQIPRFDVDLYLMPDGSDVTPEHFSELLESNNPPLVTATVGIAPFLFRSPLFAADQGGISNMRLEAASSFPLPKSSLQSIKLAINRATTNTEKPIFIYLVPTQNKSSSATIVRNAVGVDENAECHKQESVNLFRDLLSRLPPVRLALNFTGEQDSDTACPSAFDLSAAELHDVNATIATVITSGKICSPFALHGALPPFALDILLDDTKTVGSMLIPAAYVPEPSAFIQGPGGIFSSQTRTFVLGVAEAPIAIDASGTSPLFTKILQAENLDDVLMSLKFTGASGVNVFSELLTDFEQTFKETDILEPVNTNQTLDRINVSCSITSEDENSITGKVDIAVPTNSNKLNFAVRSGSVNIIIRPTSYANGPPLETNVSFFVQAFDVIPPLPSTVWSTNLSPWPITTLKASQQNKISITFELRTTAVATKTAAIIDWLVELANGSIPFSQTSLSAGAIDRGSLRNYQDYRLCGKDGSASSQFFWAAFGETDVDGFESALQNVAIMGGDSPGSDIQLPCLISLVCPSDISHITTSETSIYSFIATFDFGLPFIDLVLVFPALRFDVDIGFEPALNVITDSVNTKNAGVNPLIQVPIKVKLLNAQHIKNTIDRFNTAGFNEDIQLRGHNLFSSLVTSFVLTIDLDGLSTDAAETMYDERQWFLPLAAVGTWNIVRSTATSAVIDIHSWWPPLFAKFELFGLSLDILSGNHRLASARPRDSADLVVGGSKELRPWIELTIGAENLATAADCVAKQTPKARDPSSSWHESAALCYISEVVGLIIAEAEVEVTFIASFKNIDGAEVNVSIDFLFFEGKKISSHHALPYPDVVPSRQDDQIGAAKVSSPFNVLSNPLTPGEGDIILLDIQASVISMLESVFSSSGFEYTAQGFQVGIQNPFNFPLTLYDLEVDVLYLDPMGAFLHGGPLSLIRNVLGDHPFRSDPIILAKQLTQKLEERSGVEGIELSPDKRMWSPPKVIEESEMCLNVSEGGATAFEHAARVMNSYLEGSMCALVENGKVDMSIQGAPGDVPMKFTQEFQISSIGVIGEHLPCLRSPRCVPIFTNVLENNRPNIDSFALVGDAVLVGDGANEWVMLNNGVQNSVGAAWAPSKLHVADGFIAEFVMKAVDRSGSLLPGSSGGLADGLAFVIQKGGLNTLGLNTCETLCAGFDGNFGEASLGIVFNTYSGAVNVYRNAAPDADTGKAYAVLTSSSTSLEKRAIEYSGNAYTLTEASGMEHKIKIFYDRAFRKIFVYLNDMKRPIIDAWVCGKLDTLSYYPNAKSLRGKRRTMFFFVNKRPPLSFCGSPPGPGTKLEDRSLCVDIDSIVDGDGLALVGFTASAGRSYLIEEYEAEHYVKGFDFRTSLVNASRSVVMENGTAVAKVNSPGKFTIDSRDSCGFPIRNGVGFSWLVNLIHLETGISSNEVTVSDAGTGLFDCTWTPINAGNFEVWGAISYNSDVSGNREARAELLGIVSVRSY